MKISHNSSLKESKNNLTLWDKKFLMSCFIVESIDWLPKFKPINMFNNLYVILPLVKIKQMSLWHILSGWYIRSGSGSLLSVSGRLRRPGEDVGCMKMTNEPRPGLGLGRVYSEKYNLASLAAVAGLYLHYILHGSVQVYANYTKHCHIVISHWLLLRGKCLIYFVAKLIFSLLVFGDYLFLL